MPSQVFECGYCDGNLLDSLVKLFLDHLVNERVAHDVALSIREAELVLAIEDLVTLVVHGATCSHEG